MHDMPFTILNNFIISPLYLLYFNVGKFKAISLSLFGLLDHGMQVQERRRQVW